MRDLLLGHNMIENTWLADWGSVGFSETVESCTSPSSAFSEGRIVLLCPCLAVPVCLWDLKGFGSWELDLTSSRRWVISPQAAVCLLCGSLCSLCATRLDYSYWLHPIVQYCLFCSFFPEVEYKLLCLVIRHSLPWLQTSSSLPCLFS